MPPRHRKLRCVEASRLRSALQPLPFLQLSTGAAPPLKPLQIPEVVVSAESSIPRDASGAIDYSALAQLLRDMQSLQDQAEILYILFKDK